MGAGPGLLAAARLLREQAIRGILCGSSLHRGTTVPNTESAKKRVRQNAKRNALNNWRKRKVKDQVKSFLAAVHGKDIKAAEAEYRKTVSALDKVASGSTMHKNTASRQKSRLHKRLKALQGAAK